MIKQTVFATLMCYLAGGICFEPDALATGPANCPAGQTALAQKYGTSSYCAMNICVAEYKHIDNLVCTEPSLQYPLGQCVSTKYEARPRFPQPPSPVGAWGNQPACPAGLNSAGAWY